MINRFNSNLSKKLSRRWFLGLMLLSACSAASGSLKNRSLVVGTVSYEAGSNTLEQYDRFRRYLSEGTHARIELDPAFNESRAIERIRTQSWSLVFAPPGLSAIAISQHQFISLFPLFGVQNLRSVLVVREDSPIQDISAIAGKSVALGKPGSATGYYLPIFNLYGLVLSEFIFPPSPKAVLEAVAQGEVDVGAVSREEFDSYKGQTNPFNLRILFTDPHPIPSGSILLNPTVDRQDQEIIRNVLSQASSVLAQEAGFVTNAPVPNYQYMISVVERVRSIFPGDRPEGVALLQQKPIRLFKSK